MKITKVQALLLLPAILVTPLLYSSCGHPAAAGAAGAAAVNHHQDEQKKEDYAHAKKEQVERKQDRR
jgi:hypothetical protein